MLEFLIDAELDESFVAADGHERLARVETDRAADRERRDRSLRMMAKGHADSVAGRLDFFGADTFRALEQKIRTAARAPGPPSHAPPRSSPPTSSGHSGGNAEEPFYSPLRCGERAQGEGAKHAKHPERAKRDVALRFPPPRARSFHPENCGIQRTP